MPERPQSAWLDFTDWVKNPAYAVRALARGDTAQAGRFATDFAAGPLDAMIPGDMIPSALNETDTRDASLLAEIGLNPLTYAGLHPRLRGLAKAGGAAVAAKIPTPVRRTLGWETYDPVALQDRWYKTKSIGPASLPIPGRTIDTRHLLGQLEGVKNTTALAQLTTLDEAGKTLGRLTNTEDEAMASVIDNLDWSSGKAAVLDQNHAGTGMTGAQLATEAKKRLRMLSTRGQVDLNKLDKYIDFHYGYTEKQLGEMQSKGAILGTRNQPDYLARVYEGIDGAGAPAKPREYQDAKALADFLGKNPDIQLERRWSERMVSRAESQGRMLARAKLRTELTNDEIARRVLDPNDVEAQSALKAAMEDAQPGSDTFARLRYELYGSEPTGTVADTMRRVNRVFKPAAVYGVGPFVKLGSITRNWLTGYWQMASTPEGRAYLLNGGFGQHARTLFDAFDDGLIKNLGLQRLSKGEITGAMDAIEAAARRSGGQMDETLRLLRAHPDQVVQEAANALENGVMQGFVMSEDLAKAGLQMRGLWDPRHWLMPGNSAVADIGAKMFGGLEQRMRFAMYLNRRRAGKAAAEAAADVTDTFLDYSRSSPGNKELRTWLPFAQFMTQASKQQAKALAAAPAAIPAVAALYGGEDADGLPDYARGQAHLGNVLPGMAPTDVFNTLPDVTGSASFGEFMQSAKPLANALHPLAGAAIGVASGVDTFTGRPYLQDARLPFRDPRTTERNAADTAFGVLEDIGLAQPIAGPAQQARSLGRMESGPAALRYLTGVNVVKPDPLKAEQQRLQATVEADPRVAQFKRSFTKAEDPQLLAALKRLEEVRKELKEKAAAAAAAASSPSGPASPML